MGVILVPLDFLMEDNPDTLVILRSIAIEIGVLIIIILQFGTKILYLYRVELTTTFGSSSLGSSGGSSGANKTAALRRGAARGRFTLRPKILENTPITIATISEAERFYDERKNNASVSARKISCMK